MGVGWGAGSGLASGAGAGSGFGSGLGGVSVWELAGERLWLGLWSRCRLGFRFRLGRRFRFGSWLGSGLWLGLWSRCRFRFRSGLGGVSAWGAGWGAGSGLGSGAGAGSGFGGAGSCFRSFLRLLLGANRLSRKACLATRSSIAYSSGPWQRRASVGCDGSCTDWVRHRDPSQHGWRLVVLQGPEQATLRANIDLSVCHQGRAPDRTLDIVDPAGGAGLGIKAMEATGRARPRRPGHRQSRRLTNRLPRRDTTR